MTVRNGLMILCVIVTIPDVAAAADIRVAPGEDVQAAVGQAMPGDVVILEQGMHEGPVRTARDGEESAPIVMRGEAAILGTSGRVLDVQHAHFHVQDLVLDAQFAESRVIRVGDDGAGFRLVRSVVRNARRHCIDIRNTTDVAIESSLIHHCLNWDGGRSDAHGVSAQSVRGLTIRDTEIHTFTGDAFQIDPSRSEPGWDEVLIEGCTFWLAPVDDGSAGVPAGAVPGENAIDTKTLDDVSGRLTVRDTVAYGFRDGEIANMAAFNIKETVNAEFDSVTVYDSEIAFRLRGSSGGGTPGATVSLTNVLIYDVDKALRLESDLPATIPVHHVTFGADVGEHVDLVDGATAGDLDPQNVVVLGDVPDALRGDSSFAATVTDFEAGDYLPVATATWLDSGVDLGVTHDLRGAVRPQGAGPEPGAFEFGEGPPEEMDVGTGGGSDGGQPPGDTGTSPGPDGGTPAAGEPGDDVSSGADSGKPGGCGCSSAAAPFDAWPLFFVTLLGCSRLGRRAWPCSRRGV